MPVTIIPADHRPKLHPPLGAWQSENALMELLKYSCSEFHQYNQNSTEILASSFSTFEPDGPFPSQSSFVRSAIEAWGRHSHLVIRPEDIWFIILVQISFYMEKNAESVRNLFVAHTGKQRIEVWDNTWEQVMDQFRVELQNRIKTKWMAEWISPGFSTSTDNDERTATILMMGIMKHYFDYAGGIVCGIPSITLLGTREDWQRLLQKIDRLQDFGEDPAAYAARLRPILTRCVQTFSDPTSPEIKDFWNEMVQAKIRHSITCGEPPKQYVVSGWILGFFYWSSTGHVSKIFSKGYKSRGEPGSLTLDGVTYGEANLEDIPAGYAKAEFTVLDHYGPDKNLDAWVVAGSIGKRISQGAPEGYEGTVGSGRVNKKQAGENNTGMHATGQHQKPLGWMSRVVQQLNCFGNKSDSLSDEPEQSHDEKEKEEPGQHSLSCDVLPSNDLDEDNDFGHSTIQPLSGWFLLGPRTDLNPFLNDYGEESGPTVAAIESCKDVVHCGDMHNVPQELRDTLNVQDARF